MKRSLRPTQNDIARVAGVSTAVVSLVINGRANGKIKISQATQDRVRTAIRELGYVPNIAARQLAGGSTRVIGIFTYEPIFPLEPTSFYQPFLVGIEEQAALSDYNLLLFTRGGSPRHIYQDGVNQLLATEGAILLGTNEDRAELGRLRKDGFPFVFVGRREIDGSPIPCTAADYAGATAALIRKLLAAGHRHIRYAGMPGLNESARDRESGFLGAMRDAGVPHPESLVERLDFDTLDLAWLRRQIDAGTTALAMENIMAAVDILTIARQGGIDIPGDLSLVALGKADDPTQSHHDIDTFLIPHREMGAGAVRLLAGMLADPDTDTSTPITFPCPPAAGRTIGPPASRPDKEVPAPI